MTMVDLTDFTDPAQLPTLSNINALSIANSDAYVYSRKIYVKNQTMFDAFSTATNWSTYANQMEIVV